VAAGLVQVRRAVAERLDNIPGYQGYAFTPDSVSAPALWVNADRPVINYVNNNRSGYDPTGFYSEFRLLVTLVVNRQDIETAQEEIDDHIGPNGPIVAALQDVTIDDTLGHLTRNVTVNSAMRYGAYKIGGTDYFGVQLSVCVLA